MLSRKIIFLWLFCFINVAFAAQNSPVPMLETSANSIIDTLKKNQSSLKNHPQIVNNAITAYLLPHVDVDGMSRSVLGRQVWSKISAEERRDFVQAFSKLIIRTYAVPIAEYSGETIKFTPIRGYDNAKFVQVKSMIFRPNGQKIPLTYSLVSKNSSWMIYDLSVDGVSLLQSYKTQISNSLQKITIRELIQQMNTNKKVA